MRIIARVDGTQYISSIKNEEMAATPLPLKEWTPEEIDADIFEELKNTKQVTLSPDSQGFLSVSGASGNVHKISDNRIGLIESMVKREGLNYELSNRNVRCSDKIFNIDEQKEYTFRLILNETNDSIMPVLTPGDYGNLGWTVTTGDLNGDGYEDLVLTMPPPNNAFILFGQSGVNQKV